MKIAVVIPCFKVKRHILQVLEAVPDIVSRIFVVDDACPEGSGDFVEMQTSDSRIRVLRNATNLGVGGAVMNGYKEALAEGFDVVVKVDGDGQMNLADLPRLVQPILDGRADYTKGNRFNSVESLEAMPRLRIFGNAVLSIFNKSSSGYWGVSDPTNGYTAIHRVALRKLIFEKIDNRYFFESDMLFRLSLLRAVTMDIPMNSVYQDEKSNLRISRAIPRFLRGHWSNLAKRLIYQYYLREWTVATFELPLGLLLLIAGTLSAFVTWLDGISRHVAAAPATVMIPSLELIFGIQLFLSFINYDVASTPVHPLQTLGD